MTIVHELKCWPNYFDATKRGDKLFEVRRDDRGFQKGDILALQRTRPDRITEVKRHYNGIPCDEIRAEVLYILTGGQFGIEPGYVVMGIRVIDNGET